MHVVITGASAGIGAALARAFAGKGASLTLVARRRDRLDALAAELKCPVHVVAQDLSDLERVCDFVAPAEAALGAIDVLVNNAGGLHAGPTVDVSPEEGEAVIRLDLLSPMRLTQHVLKGMLARGAGTIVDVTAMAALTPLPGMAHYDAAKAGMAAWSEALRMELRGSGVHVVTAYPGYIADTELAQTGAAAYAPSRAERLMPRGTSTELARRVCDAVERRRARVLYPYPAAVALWLNGSMRWAMSRFAPTLRP
ncbi:MAG: SDR family NAD(P)-dependent oxidoreductase [Polyangiaceae bacterium]